MASALLQESTRPFRCWALLRSFPQTKWMANGRGYAAFRNPEIEVDKLIHFAMGVYWKASVHSWTGSSRNRASNSGPIENERGAKLSPRSQNRSHPFSIGPEFDARFP